MSAYDDFKKGLTEILKTEHPAVGPKAAPVSPGKPAVAPVKDVHRHTDEEGEKYTGKGIISSDYGNRIHPKTHKLKFHEGVDIAAGKEPVYAAATGKITHVGMAGNAGLRVKLSYTDAGNNVHTLVYMHLDSASVKKGQDVKIGDRIGVMGKTGEVTGVHLHLEHWVGNAHRRPSNYEIRVAVNGL